MSFILPFPHEGRAKEDGTPWPARGPDRRLGRANTRDGTSQDDSQLLDSAAQALSGASISRRHVVFPDPIAFR